MSVLPAILQEEEPTRRTSIRERELMIAANALYREVCPTRTIFWILSKDGKHIRLISRDRDGKYPRAILEAKNTCYPGSLEISDIPYLIETTCRDIADEYVDQIACEIIKKIALADYVQ